MSLATYIRSHAEWREHKARKHRDNERNLRAARALRELADTVEEMRNGDHAELIEAIEKLTRRRGASPGEGVQQEVARYGTNGKLPDPQLFLIDLLDIAREDQQRARPLDHLVPRIVDEAASFSDFHQNHKTKRWYQEATQRGISRLKRRAANAKALADRLANGRDLRVDLEEVHVVARLAVDDPQGDRGSRGEDGYTAHVEIDLSEHFALEQDVTDLLSEPDFEADRLSLEC